MRDKRAQLFYCVLVSTVGLYPLNIYHMLCEMVCAFKYSYVILQRL